ncbi:hypothetical protein SAMN05444358_11296 [Ruegeria halocynthiae]|uniref:Uncharacterized protein n=1 Tax=Ruegeria halocynthiae TaxID=985054 RepID=A0A1H3EX31_9RHOB|nr:hypothetical protein [Ruegeria halocynthiae]SDX83383.1 hypothetical protein SAMN05444358_11296 [Ruegeria halocynthiae]
MKIFLWILALTMLAEPIYAQNLPANSVFWSPPRSTASCWAQSQQKLPDEVTIVARGAFEGKSSAQRFTQASGSNMQTAIGSRSFNTRTFAQQYVALAQKGSFTRLPGGSHDTHPAFQSSVILINAAFAVSLFENRQAWSSQERELVVKWGNKDERNQWKYGTPSVDSVAAQGAAAMAWGAATQQQKIYKKGYSRYIRVFKRIDKTDLFEQNLRDNNETIAMIMLSAEVQHRNGLPGYNLVNNGKTLHDAVKAHSIRTLELGPTKLRTQTDDGGLVSYFRTKGYAGHLAWIPMYLSRYPNGPASADVKRLKTAVVRHGAGGKSFFGRNIGGPTDCLW